MIYFEQRAIFSKHLKFKFYSETEEWKFKEPNNSLSTTAYMIVKAENFTVLEQGVKQNRNKTFLLH